MQRLLTSQMRIDKTQMTLSWATLRHESSPLTQRSHVFCKDRPIAGLYNLARRGLVVVSRGRSSTNRELSWCVGVKRPANVETLLPNVSVLSQPHSANKMTQPRRPIGALTPSTTDRRSIAMCDAKDDGTPPGGTNGSEPGGATSTASYALTPIHLCCSTCWWNTS